MRLLYALLARFRRLFSSGSIIVTGVSSPIATEGGDLVYVVTLSGTTTATSYYSFAFYGGSVGTNDFVDFNNPTLSNGVTKTTGSSGTLTVPPGVSSFTFTWPTVDDTYYEYNPEIFNLNVGGVHIGTGSLYDNDIPSAVSLVADVTRVEGGVMTFSVSMNKPTGRPASVDYATSDNTATAGLDYTAASGTLNWGTFDGTTKTFTVAISSDLVTPEAESFFVNLSNPVACTIDVGGAVGYITDVPDPILGTATNAFTFADAGNGIVDITDTVGTATTTFTRSTTGATRIAGGLWKLDVAINQPRSYYDANGSYFGYLCERAATQLLAAGSTRDLTNVAWVATNMTVAKDQVGIDGGANSASKLTASGVNATIAQTVTAAASSRTFSAFVKRISGTGSVFLRQIGGTTSSLDITSLINSTTWTLVQLNSSQLNAQCTIELATSGDVIAVDCAQFEAGDKASTPIPSGGSRDADKLVTSVVITTGSFMTTWIPFNTVGGDLLGSAHSAGTTHFMRQATATTLTCYDGSATRTPQTVAARTVGTQYKAAFGFSGTTISSAENGINGAGSSFDGTFNGYALVIGSRTNTAANPIHGCIKNVYNWNAVRLTDLELASVTGVPAVPTLSSISATNANEGSNVVFTVGISNPYTSAQSFSYALSGTAVAGVDYTNSPTISNGCSIGGGNITFPSGVTTCTVTYPTLDNGTVTGSKTLIATASTLSATAMIYDTDALGDALSTYALSSRVVEDTPTTDTININDFTSNGVFTVVPPDSVTTYAKTVHKTGTGDANVMSKTRLGYVRLTGNATTGPRIRLGNANLGLTKRHAVGVLIRVDNTQLTSYAGDLSLVKTTQNVASGDPYFKMGLGGKSNALSAIRGLPFCQRSGKVAGVDGIVTESSPLSSGIYNVYPDIWGALGSYAANNSWAWVWVYGNDTTDNTTGYITMSEDGGAGHLGNNNIHLASALHGCYPAARSLASRMGASPSFSTASGTYIFPDVLSTVDFVIGSASDATSKTVDIARVIKVSTWPDLHKIAAMCNGMHPLTLGLMSGDDFCVDFGSSFATTTGLPVGSAEVNTGHIYTPVEDGPIATKYHGVDSTDVVVSIVNGRAV